ncbi:MAG: GYD domain-containing protein [Candidatus Limnocylindrales bacterium]
MATFVVLGNWTADGVKAYADAPKRAKASAEAAAAMGGRVVANYWTLGKYDFVSIIEAPSDEAVTAGLLVNAARGFARTVTMRAFTMDEFDGIVAQAKAAG